MRRLLAFSVIVLSLGLALAAPDDAKLLRFKGMLLGGSITRDANGIAQVHGLTEWDMHFLTGYVHAEDRLFQMDTQRHIASGTLAEMVGPSALPSDVLLRTLGLRRTAAKALGLISWESRAALNAYALGVNTWVAHHPLPPEYAALGLTHIEPWTALDSVAFANLFLFSQNFDDSDAARTQLLLAYIEAGAASGLFNGQALFSIDLARTAPFDPTTTLPPAEADKAAMAAPMAAAARAALPAGLDPKTALATIGHYLARVEAAPYYQEAINRNREHGSNEWAVSGRLSRSRRPLLANDPHLGLGTPATWYPIALRGGFVNVSGVSAAGVPFVIAGNTRTVSWGITDDPTDVTDFYLEQVVPDPASPSGMSTVYRGTKEPIIPIPEVFRQNNPGSGIPDNITVVPPGGPIPPFTLIVPRRNNGPIAQLDVDPTTGAGTAISIQYSGFAPTREIDAFRAFNLARTVEDIRAGIRFLTVAMFNWSVVDTRGKIAYFTTGEVPLREDLQAGTVNGLPPWFLRDGTGGNEWLPRTHTYPGQALPYEILPFSEHPQAINPPAGYFVNANNDPIGVTLDNNPLGRMRPGGGILYLNYAYDGFRAGRITQRIEEALHTGDGKLDIDEMRSIQADNVLIDAQYFVPHVVQAFDHATSSGAPAPLAALAADPRIREAVTRFSTWDFSTPTGLREGWDPGRPAGVEPPPSQVEASVAATIYATWRGRFAVNVIDATLAPFHLPPPGNDNHSTLPALRHMLDVFPVQHGVGASGLDFFAVPGVADPDARRDIVILKSLGDALDLLAGPAFTAAFGGSTDQADYRWGKVHRIVFAHLLGGPFSIPPAGGAFPPSVPGLSGISRSGGEGTVDVANHIVRVAKPDDFMFGSGPSRRYVCEADRDGIDARSSLPGGISGVLGSPLYFNLLPMWLTNGTYPAPVQRGDWWDLF